MEVNERTYRWSESGSKVCVSCDSGDDETIEHVVLVCGRYELLRGRMMGAVRLEIGAWVGDADEWTPGEWMRVLLGLGDRVSDAIVGAVKEFLDEMWSPLRWPWMERGSLSRWLPRETICLHRA